VSCKRHLLRLAALCDAARSSKCITMHIRNWVAAAKIRLDQKRKARAAQEAEDSAAAVQVAPVASAGVGAGLRRRAGKTKKT
jgi:hypothetical protein